MLSNKVEDNSTKQSTLKRRLFPLRSNGLSLGIIALAVLATPNLIHALGPPPVDLRTASSFTILSGAGITTTGGGHITGNVGTYPMTGAEIHLTDPQVDGIIYSVDAAGPPGSVIDPALLLQAKDDLTSAYNFAAGLTPVPSGPFLNPNGGNIGGLALVPGLYKFTSTALITGSDVTLVGGPDDVWVFQIAADLQVGTSIKVILAGGARASNIFWQVGTSAVLGTFSEFKGTILADQSIIMNTSSTLDGRALAFSAGVTYNGASGDLPDDYVLTSADFNPGAPASVQPNSILDVTWSVAGSPPGLIWAELFLSKTGGFDFFRVGATLTNSSRFNFPGVPVNHTPGNQVVNYIPDGVYTVVPMINRPDTGGPIESNYVNNWAPIAQKRILIRNNQTATSNLAWSGSPSFVVSGENVTVSGTIINLSGTTPAYGFWAETMYGVFTAEGLFLAEGYINGGVKYSTSMGLNETTSFTQAGIAPAGKDLVVVVDSTDIISETEERNNSAYYRVSTPVGRGTLDLTVMEASFSASQLAPTELNPFGSLQWSATIRNNSTQPTGDFWVELFHSNNGGIGTLKSGTTLTQSEKVSLAASETKVFNFNQPFNQITDGIYSAVAVANRNSVGANPGDTNPADNSYVLPGRVVLINNTTSTANLRWNAPPVVTRTGNLVSVTGRVINAGLDATTASSWVEAYRGTMDIAGRYTALDLVAGGVLVPPLAPGEGYDITINGGVLSGSWVVGVIIDSTDLVPETDETDNYTYHPE